MISKEELIKLDKEVSKLRKNFISSVSTSNDMNDPMNLDILKSLNILDNKLKYYLFNYSALKSRKEAGLEQLDF